MSSKRSPEARMRRAAGVARVVSHDARQRAVSAAHSELIARALRFACGSRRGGVDDALFTDDECEWMAATATRLEESA